MTQEELDALMNGDLDSVEDDSLESEESDEIDVEQDYTNEIEVPTPDELEDRRVHPKKLVPPPPYDDNKVVHQLDDVTKESEEKATQIFDIVENISNDMMEKEENISSCIKIFENNIKLFTNLTEKFPDIQTFKTAREENEEALAGAQEVFDSIQESGNSLMNVMDIMQYQDIHRQKIERVINVMRALSNYMNALFAGKIDDDKRVSSAVHLPGDESTEDVVNADDIEALLAQFGANG
ncbi:chemotaxis protein [Sulfurimonas sp. HSL-1716]|uniref:chemotaxis protein n=1 Tax=Hydrocurvibacter sulfurireducens TaxID=3131937 RepID=UPI0031F966A4